MEVGTGGWTVGTASPAEVDRVVEWAAAEGWNPGLADAGAFLAADPAGFVVGRADGEAVASISAVAYGSSFGFVGFYLVVPRWRGRGLGLATWRAGLERLEGRVLGLDGVVDQVDAYRRSGFAVAWHNERRVLADPSSVAPSGATVPLGAVDLDELVAYDRAVFPDDRRAFLAAWRSMPGAVGRAVVDGGRLRGWGLRRPCREGAKIGPLFADDAEVAAALFGDLAGGTPGPVVLDVPEPNPVAARLVRRHGMPTVFRTVRMYRGDPPAIDVTRTVGVTTFELG